MRDNKLIQFYITNMCNSHCKTCSIWKNKEKEELKVSDIISVVEIFPKADYVIGGGEAILHSEIERLLDYLQNKEINYTLLSNCIFVEKLIELVQRFKVKNVTVSFDGIKHNEIRGSLGNLPKIVEFKNWCDTYLVNFKLSYTYSKYNEGYFEKDMRFIRQQFGLDEIYFCLAQDMDLLRTTESDESFVAEDFEQILKCNMITDKDKRHIRSMITGVRRPCTSQNNVHTIYSNGDIVRCQSFKSREVLGNINNMLTYEIMKTLESVENIFCPYDVECNLLCQRRYD